MRRDLLQPHLASIAAASLAQLRSRSPLQAAGALRTLTVLVRQYNWTKNPQGPARIHAEILDAADSQIALHSPDVLQPLALYLGAHKSDRSRQLLWRIVEEGTAREQALLSLTSIADKRDLPRLATHRDDATARTAIR